MYKSFSSLPFHALEFLASGRVMFAGTCTTCLFSALIASEFTEPGAEGMLIICSAMVLSSIAIGGMLYAVTDVFEKALNYKIQGDQKGWKEYQAYEEAQREWDLLFYD